MKKMQEKRRKVNRNGCIGNLFQECRIVKRWMEKVEGFVPSLLEWWRFVLVLKLSVLEEEFGEGLL